MKSLEGSDEQWNPPCHSRESYLWFYVTLMMEKKAGTCRAVPCESTTLALLISQYPYSKHRGLYLIAAEWFLMGLAVWNSNSICWKVFQGKIHPPIFLRSVSVICSPWVNLRIPTLPHPDSSSSSSLSDYLHFPQCLWTTAREWA